MRSRQAGRRRLAPPLRQAVGTHGRSAFLHLWNAEEAHEAGAFASAPTSRPVTPGSSYFGPGKNYSHRPPGDPKEDSRGARTSQNISHPPAGSSYGHGTSDAGSTITW